ncbi:MAG: FtsW/RodA/SpoVE family cell cycle protein [Bacteroidetes bacterium]|nr:FtsW/RodA/SpoVE family cell cycle protein [Bacteroidota bacterium]
MSEVNRILNKLSGDKVIWVVAVMLSIFSVLVVYSASGSLAYKYKGGNTEFFLFKQVGFVALALGFIYLTHLLKYSYYSRGSQIALFVAAPLLLFTLVKGVSAGDASRWIAIPGIGFTFQTSDFAKLALVVYVARLLSMKQDQIKDFKEAFVPIVLPILIICGLILPANFSTAAVLFVTCIVLMFIGRVNIKYILLLIGSGIVFLGLFILLVFTFPHINNRVETWKTRIESFVSGDSDENYQAEQAMIAIATGGPIGKGPGKSTQRNFLPQASSDFIFAIIIEEYGSILGGFLVIFLYMILLFRATRIATKSPKTFGSLLAIGLCFMLVFQAMINMGVAVHLFPVTGQPLPMVSAGGTSVIFSSIAIGIILSVSREIESEKKGELADA